MPEQALAYLITFSTYGSWLHGDERGSVDREHNVFGTSWLEADFARHRVCRDNLADPPCLLDAARRGIVRDAIVEECAFRGWLLLALHVRSNHLHLVAQAAHDPDAVMRSCKSQASKRLNQAKLDQTDRKRWTKHGSTKYLWDVDAVTNAVMYTLNRQGEAMALHEGPWQEFVRQHGDSVRA
jgi:REP element-mobilizing transposase RayT